jgi:hypothetical protein
MASIVETPSGRLFRRVVMRSTVLGAAVGVLVGGVIETFSFPLVGTFFGAVVGGLAGAGTGLVGGLVLAGVGVWTRSSFIERLAADSASFAAMSSTAGRVVGAGAVGGAALGGIAGLIIGLVSYPPTAAFAVIEGGVLGGGSGVVLALAVVAVLIVPRLRANR